MSGFLSAPQFSPPVQPISLGTNGQVLTMVGARPQFSNAAGGGGIGPAIAFNSPAGVIDPNIVGFTAGVGSAGTGRIKVTLAADTSWEGLPAGTDGQQLVILVVAGNFTLTLLALSGATAQAKILSNLNFAIRLNSSLSLTYDATLAQWILTP